MREPAPLTSKEWRRLVARVEDLALGRDDQHVGYEAIVLRYAGPWRCPHDAANLEHVATCLLETIREVHRCVSESVEQGLSGDLGTLAAELTGRDIARAASLVRDLGRALERLGATARERTSAATG
jgi:hypothetical protein